MKVFPEVLETIAVSALLISAWYFLRVASIELPVSGDSMMQMLKLEGRLMGLGALWVGVATICKAAKLIYQRVFAAD
jgi:hypothetical protein